MAIVQLAMDNLSFDCPDQPRGVFSVRCVEHKFSGQFDFIFDLREQAVIIMKKGVVYAEQKNGVPKHNSGRGQQAILRAFNELFQASQQSIESCNGDGFIGISADWGYNYPFDLQCSCNI